MTWKRVGLAALALLLLAGALFGGVALTKSAWYTSKFGAKSDAATDPMAGVPSRRGNVSQLYGSDWVKAQADGDVESASTDVHTLVKPPSSYQSSLRNRLSQAFGGRSAS